MPGTRTDAPPSWRRIARSVVAAAAISIAVGGCGSGDELSDREPAPVQITLSVALGRHAITVSPARIGAGPVELLASNQTPVSQQLTLRSVSTPGAAPLLQRTGPINPGDTASLTADLGVGTYRLTTGSREREPATLHVDRAQQADADRLLQP